MALRSTAVAVNFGAPGKRPWKELPFQVRMLDDAAAVDVRGAGAGLPGLPTAFAQLHPAAQ